MKKLIIDVKTVGDKGPIYAIGAILVHESGMLTDFSVTVKPDSCKIGRYTSHGVFDLVQESDPTQREAFVDACLNGLPLRKALKDLQKFVDMNDVSVVYGRKPYTDIDLLRQEAFAIMEYFMHEVFFNEEKTVRIKPENYGHKNPIDDCRVILEYIK